MKLKVNKARFARTVFLLQLTVKMTKVKLISVAFILGFAKLCDADIVKVVSHDGPDEGSNHRPEGTWVQDVAAVPSSVTDLKHNKILHTTAVQTKIPFETWIRMSAYHEWPIVNEGEKQVGLGVFPYDKIGQQVNIGPAGKYTVMLQNEKKCWLDDTFQVSIINKDTEGLPFVRSGYIIACNRTHDVLVTSHPLFQESNNFGFNLKLSHGPNVETEMKQTRSAMVPVGRLVAGTVVAFTRPEDEVCKDVTIPVLVQNSGPSPALLPLKSNGELKVTAEILKQGTCDINLSEGKRKLQTCGFETSLVLPDKNEQNVAIAQTTSPRDLVEHLFSAQNENHDLVRSGPQGPSGHWLDQSDMPSIEKGKLIPVMSGKTTSCPPWLQDSGIEKSPKESKFEVFHFLIATV